MVLVNDKKYACETCIKGHRSSACQHTDRPLYEIKKKGRPVTQCEHCRELRKTKQVHVKCMCESKEDLDAQPSHSIPAKKANRAGLVVSAAFPHGLPSSSASSAAAVGTSPQADSPTQRIPCTCKAGGQCQCCTPRRPQKANQTEVGSGSAPPNATPPKSRLTHMRPIVPSRTSYGGSPGSEGKQIPIALALDTNQLPRPAYPSRSTQSTPFYRPYDSFVDRNSQFLPQASGHTFQVPPLQSFGTLASTPSPHQSADSARSSSGSPGQWSGDGDATMDFWKAMCQCGDNCGCPGCYQHHNNTQGPSPQTCTNPGRCQSCFNCMAATFMNSAEQDPTIDQFTLDPTLATSLPSPYATGSGADIGFQPYYGSNMNLENASGTSDFTISMGYLPQNMAGVSNTGDATLFGGPMPQVSMMPTPSAFQGPTQLHPRCRRCGPGQCACRSNDCGCDYGEEPNPFGRDPSLTFATSGERAPCCGGGSSGSQTQSRSQPQSSEPSSSQPSRSQSGRSSFTNLGQMNLSVDYQEPVLTSSLIAPLPIALSSSGQHLSLQPLMSTYLPTPNSSSSILRTTSTGSYSSDGSTGGSRRGSASDSGSSSSGRRLVRAILPKGHVTFPDYD